MGDADKFGELVVRAILSAGLNARTAEVVSDKLVAMLREGRSPSELLQAYGHAGKIRNVIGAWERRVQLHDHYRAATDRAERIRCLDGLPGIGRISAEKVDDVLQSR